MGNKKAIIIIIIVMIVLNSMVFYAIVKSKQVYKDAPVAENISEKMVANNDLVDIKLEENKNENLSKNNNGTSKYLRCVWGKDEKFIPYIVYFDGATRMRNETRVPLDPAVPEKGKAYEIIDKDLQYKWDSTSSNGRKKVIPLEEGYTYEKSFASMMEEVTGDSDYTCQSWKVDESLFIPPADIIFIEKKQ